MSFAIGLRLAPDYGISWDEQINREFGHHSLDLALAAFTSGSPPADAPRSVVEYGPAVEMALAALERVAGLEDDRDVFVLRHRVTFVLWTIGVIAFGFALRRIVDDELLAVLGAAALALTPRLFADSFYNSKDAALAALFSIALLSLLRLGEKRSVGRAIVHAFVCGVAIDVRLVALLLPAATLAFVMLEVAAERNRDRAFEAIRALSAHLVALAGFVVLFWPGIWDAPFEGLREALVRIGDARQIDNAFALYRGSFVAVDALPWHYLPTWIALTTPPWMLLLFVIGIAACLLRVARAGFLAPESRKALLVLGLFAAPVVSVLVFRPVLYDGWRHLYFVTPSLVAIAWIGAKDLSGLGRLRPAVVAAIVLGLGSSTLTLFRMHPHQQVYMNLFAPDEPHRFYEADYWGLSYRDALEEIVRRHPSGTIEVAVADLPGLLNAMILPRADRERILFTPIREARYFVSNHRQPHQHRRFLSGEGPYGREVFSVRVGGMHLVGVYEIGD